MSGRFGGYRGAILLLAILMPMLAFALWGLRGAWRMSGNTVLGVHGWIALTLAAVFTVGLGSGLMWLAFYSSRHGYDDQQVGGPAEPEDDPPG